MALFPDDIIDTRKILERIEEIESETLDKGLNGHIDILSAELLKEWTGLQEVISEVGEGASRYGVTLIHENYFEDHIKEERLEIGPELHEFNPDTYRYDLVRLSDLFSRSPFDRIDWGAVAEDYRSDYSVLEVDGVTYYYIAE